MDIERLKKLDLKSFDARKAIASLLAQKELLAQVVVVVCAILGVLFLAHSFMTQNAEYHRQTEALNKKIGLIDDYNGTTKKIKKFLGKVPQGLSDSLLPVRVTEMAVQNHVRVASYTPVVKKEEGVSKAVSGTVMVSAGSYKDFLRFLNSIEESNFALKVESVRLNPHTVASGDNPAKQAGLDAELEVSSVSLKE